MKRRGLNYGQGGNVSRRVTDASPPPPPQKVRMLRNNRNWVMVPKALLLAFPAVFTRTGTVTEKGLAGEELS